MCNPALVLAHIRSLPPTKYHQAHGLPLTPPLTYTSLLFLPQLMDPRPHRRPYSPITAASLRPTPYNLTSVVMRHTAIVRVLIPQHRGPGAPGWWSVTPPYWSPTSTV